MDYREISDELEYFNIRIEIGESLFFMKAIKENDMAKYFLICRN